MAAPPPPPALVADVIEEVLLRVPPDDPALLVRAALVCKLWCRVATGPDFGRRFRERHGAAAPMLGLICNLAGADYGDAGAARFVPMTSFRPPSARGRGRGWRALDSRHGRVLLGNFFREGGPLRDHLVVWDPIRSEQMALPALPRHLETLPWSNWNAAVLCAAAPGACDHLHCSRGPFLVAFVGSNLDFAFALVYSSEAGEWSEPTFLFQRIDLDCLPCSALVANVVHFQLEMGVEILKYDLSTREMSMINLPLRGDYGQRIALMSTDDGTGLGFASTHGSRLHLWSREDSPDQDARWVQSRIIELKRLLPADALSISPYLVGFADGFEVLFVRTFNGLFGIDLKSGWATKLHESSGICSAFPFVSFCTPAM